MALVAIAEARARPVLHRIRQPRSGKKWDGIPFPENAHVFPGHAEKVFFPSEADCKAEIIGISHSRKNENEDLTEGIRGGERFSIAVVHCDLDSASEGKKYAPARMESLLGKNIDYWALGHIHKRNIIRKFPHVVYPGNAQGRSVKESGEKGAYLVTVSNDAVVSEEFFRACKILWYDLEMSITGKTAEEFLEIPEMEEGSLARISVKGSGPLDCEIRAHRASFKEMLERKTRCSVELEIESSPLDLESKKRSGDFSSAVLQSGDALSALGKDSLIDRICGSKASLSLRHVFEGMDPKDLRKLVDDAQLSALAKLAEAGK
jgi:DNA repair exonuclease SbcCD nuclease subunit